MKAGNCYEEARTSPTTQSKTPRNPSTLPPSETLRLAALREPALDGLRRPVEDGVRGVIEHLADDLSPRAGIGAALDLDERGDAVLVQEKVVQGPAGSSLLLVRDADLSGDEEPAARRARIDLVSGEQAGEDRWRPPVDPGGCPCLRGDAGLH